MVIPIKGVIDIGRKGPNETRGGYNNKRRVLEEISYKRREPDTPANKRNNPTRISF